MKFILDAEKLWTTLASMTPDQHGDWIRQEVLELRSGVTNEWARPMPAGTTKAVGGAYTPEFEVFWATYPQCRRTAKGMAFRSWQKIVQLGASVDPDRRALWLQSVCQNALAWQSLQHDWTKENGQYVPMPATYLNQRRWEDEPPKIMPRAKQRVLNADGIWVER